MVMLMFNKSLNIMKLAEIDKVLIFIHFNETPGKNKICLLIYALLLYYFARFLHISESEFH